MLTTVFASQTVLRRFVGHSGRVWASARAPLRLPVPMQQMQQLLQRGRQFYSTASTSGDNNNKSMPPNPPATAAKREMTPDEQAALKFMKLTPSQKVASYVFKSKIVVALLKYGPAFGVLYVGVNFLTIMTMWGILCLPSMESVNIVHLLDSVGLRGFVDRYLIDVSHIKPVWSNLFMAYVVNHLFGPVQVPFTLWITPKLHDYVDPYMPTFLLKLQEWLQRRVAQLSGDDVPPEVKKD